MTETSRRPGPAALFVLLLGVGSLSFAWRLNGLLPTDQWEAALFAPGATYAELLVHESLFPRALVALICGAALAVAGALLQQALANPLAEPATLGVSSGAFLALALVGVWAPELAVSAREIVSLCGAGLAAALVFVAARPQRYSPLSLVLSGLVISMGCGAAAAAVALFYQTGMLSLFVWGSGSLAQNDWSAVTFLGPRLAILIPVAAILARPLGLLSLGESAARSLGLSPRALQIAAVMTATAIAALTVSAVGVVGFIGLAAPMLAALAGARRYPTRLCWSALLGAALLFCADEVVQQISAFAGEDIPTGGVTAVLGAPLLLVMARRLRPAGIPSTQDGRQLALGRPGLVLGLVAAALAAVAWLSLSLGPHPDGWRLVSLMEINPYLPWRAARLGVAAGAGALLGVSGVIIQRLTANPMASPELLGVSAGSAFGVMAMTVLVASPDALAWASSAGLGALVAFVIVALIARRSAFSPELVILAGVVINTLLAAVMTTWLGTGDPRVFAVARWMSGSTYFATSGDALTALAASAAAVACVPLVARWLDILPLGMPSAQAMGVDPAASRSILMVATAVSAAAASVFVGPLTFVGLIAPHVARSLGCRRAMTHLFGSALVGSLVLASGDWIARVAFYPNQLPLGVVGTLLGGLYFIGLAMTRR